MERRELDGQQEYRVYNGKSCYFPILIGNFNWTINDSTNGKLPVTYNGMILDEWITHHTPDKSPQALVSDLLPLTVPGIGTIDGYSRDDKITRILPDKPYVKDYNIENYRVQYVQRFCILNTGNTTRRVKLAVRVAPQIPEWESANVVFKYLTVGV